MSTERLDQVRREMQERQYRMQDSHERAQYAVAEQLFQTEEALSNRVRIFAAAVLAVSWGLLLDRTGTGEPAAFGVEGGPAFNLVLVFAAAILSMVSLIFDFAYWSFRRSALRASYHQGAGVIGGIGKTVPLMHGVSILRAIAFFGATIALTSAAVLAFAPHLTSVV